MSFRKYLTRSVFISTSVWLVITVIVFVVLFLPYKLLVMQKDDFNDYVLPNRNSDVAVPLNQVSKEVPDLIEDDSLNADNYNPLITTDPLQSVEKVSVPLHSTINYVIKSGDTLGRIFSNLGLSRESMHAVLDADQEYLVLEPLLPKDKYAFKLDKNGELIALTRRIDISKEVSFVKHDSGGFSYEENITPITYTQRVIHSKVEGNFYISAKKAGLTDANILLIHDVLAGRVDFRKDLRANDEFDLIIKDGTIGGVTVGTTQLEALQIKVKGQTYRAFLHSDGRFYDQNGNSLTPSLRRWPTSKQYRISSPFNANRRHPITGHPAPHNGVDLATPSGTQVLATGDGVVTRIANHKYAGRYVVIDYTGPYSSRFLHLSKILVKKGQKVKRGQVVALSGNTGRTTGAHLHYELHIKGRPVNPMTTSIPTTQSISSDNKSEFDGNVRLWIGMMAKDVSQKQDEGDLPSVLDEEDVLP
ncbi:peptidoglycan DD-metalloendopeptidase family protein [Marinomonas colpomeniae]|uniref:Peptidoglycan DD-metalloendopeptidase family protein n=1 Tax=Marinomonas colpomeniae TaxID=2774408 RepID=A0ABR8NVF3_9GAMM|nr:peptidoglycan DD-metalloendopeptidase family protein [Marinomonas colpomeniae]MBD5770033.1 peptidoglycan DD-metalloendopeptidase family protein [Marinomonas colpomeniae]